MLYGENDFCEVLERLSPKKTSYKVFFVLCSRVKVIRPKEKNILFYK